METKEPKDLGIEIGSKEMAEWKAVMEAQEETIIKSSMNVMIAKNVLLLARAQYLEEEAKFKRK